MDMIKKYKFGLDVGGMILFLLVMMPNFIRLAIPAPNDILSSESKTQVLDMIASVFQIIFIAALCLLIRQESRKTKNNTLCGFHLSPWGVAAIICVGMYFVGWILYYSGNASAAVILLLTIPPCLSFVFYEIERKNTIALIPTLAFSCCHLIYAIVNFIA